MWAFITFDVINQIIVNWKNELIHYDVNAQSFNPGLQYPHLHGPVHTPDNNRWDTPSV